MRLDHLFFNHRFCQEPIIDKRRAFYSSSWFFSLCKVLSYSQVLLLSSSSFTYFFPVFIAVLQHTFPSRTRLLRGPATMILYVRVWESSSTPDFFCPSSRWISVCGAWGSSSTPVGWFSWVVAGHNQTINMIELQNKELKNAWDALNYFWVPEIL